MLTYFAIFSAGAICAGWLAAKIFEWRQDVLYGPYISWKSEQPNQRS